MSAPFSMSESYRQPYYIRQCYLGAHILAFCFISRLKHWQRPCILTILLSEYCVQYLEGVAHSKLSFYNGNIVLRIIRERGLSTRLNCNNINGNWPNQYFALKGVQCTLNEKCCQAQAKTQLQPCLPELSLISNSSHPPIRTGKFISGLAASWVADCS